VDPCDGDAARGRLPSGPEADIVTAPWSDHLAHLRALGLPEACSAGPIRPRSRLLRDAVDRGCTTASLQSTPMAEGVYAAVGFRDLGRFIEYVPLTRSG
jgi:hypothetical protein